MPHIDAVRLDQLRHRGDPAADEVAAAYLDGDPGEMFAGVVAARYAGSAGTVDRRLAAWFDHAPGLPKWADEKRLQQGADFFEEWGIQLGLGLFLSSLPLAYASHDGAQVLALTARLQSDAKRRVLESAQFVLDVTASDGLAPGREGYRSCRHVRLMHAGVRHLIVGPDSRVPRTVDEAVHPRWDPFWGVPINQEHLLGAMLSFSSSLLHVLDTLHFTYDPAGAEAYCHLWNVVGHLLGIEPDLLPLDRAQMDDLETLIRERNEQPSEAGTMLTEALLEVVQSFIPVGLFKGAAVSTMRSFVGDETADLLRVPPADWTRFLLGALTSENGRISAFLASDALARAVTKQLSKRVLTGFVEHERGHDRPEFRIPTHLDARIGPGPIRRTVVRPVRRLRSKLTASPT